MGMWDYEAWDNDMAADWFGSLMTKTQLRTHWLETMQSTDDLEDECEEVRAAIWLFAQLGRVYIWPIEHYDQDLALAIATAEKLIASEYLNEEIPDYVERIKHDLAMIKTRLPEAS